MRDLIGIVGAVGAIVAFYVVAIAAVTAVVGLAQGASINAGAAFLLLVLALPLVAVVIERVTEKKISRLERLTEVRALPSHRRSASGRAA